MAVDKAALLRPRCPERDVELPGVGTVRVRGFTRAEVLEIGKRTNDGEYPEAYALSLAMVDPTLSEDEARQWTEVASFGEMETLNQAINELSGIAGRADKEAYKSPGDESGA
jgi:predicted HAD superfamily Cof-like phosphohydrolase